jgi:hypothetical protein
LHMLRWLYTYVARVCSKCFTCVWAVQAETVLMFQKYVAISGCCICCSGYTHMLHEYIPNVSHVCGKRRQRPTTTSVLAGYTLSLQLSNRFIWLGDFTPPSRGACLFHPRGRAAYICCNCYTRVLQVYVLNVLAVSKVCCKCFI